MRLRILELPTQHDGDKMRTPFLFVIDAATDVQIDQLKHMHPDHWNRGDSQGLFIFNDTVTLPYEEDTK